MKVGILTYHNTLSYGAHLQAYALQQVVKRLGHDVLIVNYRGNVYSDARLGTIFKARTIGGLIANYNTYMFTRGCSDFNHHLRQTRKYADGDALRKDPPGMDAYIAGSDQIWQLRTYRDGSRFDSVYYLDFAEHKSLKIAYAPSFGHDVPMARIEEVRDLLKAFDFLSVREACAAEKLSILMHSAVATVCDPTILLGRDGFDELLADREREGKRSSAGVFYFSLNPQMYRDKYLVELTRKIWGPVTIAQRTARMFFWGKNFNGCPVEWIRRIRNSKFILSNSFHGTVFSILYHKPFLYLPWQNQRQNVRVEQLLAKLGLMDRFYSADSNNIEEMISGEDMKDRWADIDHRVTEWREDSMHFLKTSLSVRK